MYVNRLPGNVSDVATLRYFLGIFGYLVLPRLRLVLEKWFYSEKNMNGLFTGNSKFIMAVPGRRARIRQSLMRNVIPLRTRRGNVSLTEKFSTCIRNVIPGVRSVNGVMPMCTTMPT
jgi:hypothetical protein